MNNREESNFVMERLDRAFASVEWVNTYPNYALRNFPILCFDHGPIILDFEFQHPFRRRPFRFEHMWITHPTCKDMVQHAWDIHTKGSRAFQLKNKLSNVGKEVFGQNKKVFGRVECEIKLKQAQLQNIQNSINSVEDVRKEKAIREEPEVLLNREELLWAQKARSDWTLLGDRNTRFFQTAVKQRRARSRILHSKDRDGNLIETLRISKTYW